MADAQNRPEVAQLVTEYHQAVYRYAYRLTGSVHDAEDLTQQVFLLVQKNLGQLRDVGNVKAWIFAIARNCFLRDRQQRRLALASDLDIPMEGVRSRDSENTETIDRDELQAAINRLPEVSRVVLLMFYFEECSYKEIAERLEMPIGTVMSRLARAKDHLRSVLLPEEAGPHRLPSGSGVGRGKRP